jgi:fucose permease
MRWTLILAGIGLLLTGSYVDNLRGLLLPVITKELSLNYSHSSWFLVAGTLAAIAWNLGLIPLARRFSKREIVLWTCVLSSVLLTAGFWVKSFLPMVLFGFLLGTFVTIMGSMSNLVVLDGTNADNRSRSLCLLHLMYGVGSFFGPVIGALMLQAGLAWPWALLVSWVGLVPLFLFAKLKYPKVDRQTVRQAADLENLDRRSYLAIFAFALYIAGEVSISAWLSTYLVEGRGMTVVETAPYITGFFAVMAASRALCFLTLRPVLEGWIIMGSVFVALAAFAFGWYVHPVGFAAMGILGPFFPLLLSRLTRVFPRSSATIVLVVQASGQVALALNHLLVGTLIDVAGISAGFLVPPILLVFTVGFLAVFFRRARLTGNSTMSSVA